MVMKPLNTDIPGCDPISSNCVIWQGPDIECIKLCKGDKVTDVIYKLATELCEVLDTLNIESYDISCLSIDGCGPEDFQQLIQLLITKICALEGITPVDPNDITEAGNASGVPVQTPILAGNRVPDAVIAFPEIFQYKNPQGDLVTQGQLVDLVSAAANRIQSNVGQINTINNTLANHDLRIKTLEEAPAPSSNLPSIVPTCVLTPGDAAPLDQVVVDLEKLFCELQNATGIPQAIYEALVAQCIGLNDSPRLQGQGNMNTLVGWNDDVSSMAEGFNNIWLTICDLRAAVQSIQQTCCTTTSCDDLAITLQGTLNDPNTLILYLSGTYPSGFQEDPNTGALATIVDASGNELTLAVPITVNLNDPAGFTVNLATTPINGNSNLMITLPITYTDGESECSTVLTEVVVSTENCPTVTLIPTETTINWEFTYLGGAASIDVVLYDATGTVVIQNQVNAVTGPTTLNNTFSGLTGGIQYKVRLEITPSGAPEATLCPFGNVTTTVPLCQPPQSVTAVLTIP
jgi:hypothetical protein